MASVTESVDVDVPVATAYNQWTQFEEFPRFMEGVEQVRQLDDTTMHWVVSIAGRTHEWDAKITEQHPDHRVAWTSVDGTGNSGVVTFHRLDEAQTRVTVQLEWEPEGPVERAGSALGVDSRQVKGDLERFKELIERRGVESGGWRGEVEERPAR